MGAALCRVQDPIDNKIYILTDNNKQPLFCKMPLEDISSNDPTKAKVTILNFNKYFQNPEKYNPNDIEEITNIPCVLIKSETDKFLKESEILKNIDVSNYNMTEINRDALISDIYENPKLTADRRNFLVNKLKDPSTNLINFYNVYYGTYYLEEMVKISKDDNISYITSLTYIFFNIS